MKDDAWIGAVDTVRLDGLLYLPDTHRIWFVHAAGGCVVRYRRRGERMRIACLDGAAILTTVYSSFSGKIQAAGKVGGV